MGSLQLVRAGDGLASQARQVAKFVPASSGAAVVVATGTDRPVTTLRDEGRHIRMAFVPWTRIEQPDATVAPWLLHHYGQFVLGNQLTTSNVGECSRRLLAQ